MAFRDELPTSLYITDLDGEIEPLTVDCVLKPHKDTNLEYETAELFGTHSQHLKLFTITHHIVRFEHLVEKSDRQPILPDGMGRIEDVSWGGGTSVGPEARIRKIGRIRILRYNTYHDFGHRKSERNYCTTIYNRVIGDWGSSGIYGVSYDGSIELRKFRKDVNVFHRTITSIGKTQNNYFHIDRDHITERFHLPSISLRWNRRTDFDYERNLKCAEVLLSFVNLVTLKPIELSILDENISERRVWPEDIDRTPTHNRLEGPVSYEHKWPFLKSAHKKLLSQDINLKLLGDAVNRFVYAFTEVTVEQSFTAGCESIEALFKLTPKRKAVLSDSYENVYRSIKSVLRHEIEDKGEKQKISGMIKSALLGGKWNKIFSYLIQERAKFDQHIAPLLQVAKFHRYRNQQAHGARAKDMSEMLFQRELMMYAFTSLFLAIIGDKKTKPNLHYLLQLEISQAREPTKFVNIYD